MTQIAFIGGGNMATAIIGGLLRQGDLSAQLIQVSDPGEDKRQTLANTFGIQTFADNLEAIRNADTVILAVKPQMMKGVLQPLRETLKTRQPLLVSIAAGITLSNLSQWSGCNAIVRCMPNTPALLGAGATGLIASDGVSINQRNGADRLLQATGSTVWLKDEQELDIVTALSGSGPAYYFLMMEAMIAAATRLGLSEDTARALTVQTALGAGMMASQSDVGPAELRRRVTSPGGTTERAIFTFEGAHIRDIVQAAMSAAQERAAEMNRELSE
ncbi:MULTISPECIES: pyrroline-5-carboxylate reductase [Oceanospirillaceae]|jgi:pyrroline-5-carboxylate reductase|uniref:Pyrroline-5-carboxylate reductase n=1 Tax=Oceanobacter antarcticus TaxID=3133425 RepID=A0ABW8NHA1_9GAMM|tara:strand:- start:14560 stop:15378 length:819 start_codon:yes stop_codon:yes gene_type:complete